MRRILRTIAWILLILIIGLFLYLFVGETKQADKIEWGLTFSKKAAMDYTVDWQKMFLSILDDLKIKEIRLIAYWDEIEKTQDKYDFTELDWQINEVSKRGGEIILAVGRRLPRWPECFSPEWIKDFSTDQQQEEIINYIRETVNHYKNNQSIKIWQVENEPFLRTFGICPTLDKSFLQKELDLVKSLDSTPPSSGQARPVMITESGEFSTWIGGAKRADIIGTSIYRIIHGKLGYVTYPIPAIFYARKSNLIRLLFGPKRIIAVEVQAEPWGSKAVKDMTSAEQDKSMSFEQFNKNINYVQRTGFDEAYLWGVEWWYWRKINGDDRFWNRAKELF
jgi:hypothetical protein